MHRQQLERHLGRQSAAGAPFQAPNHVAIDHQAHSGPQSKFWRTVLTAARVSLRRRCAPERIRLQEDRP